MTKNILVAVAWPYANGDLHIGHFAGAFLPADIFARYHRLCGNHVLKVSGSDAHGTPITIAADKQGVSPRQVFEQYHQRFLQTLQTLGLSFDLFTHTDTENHTRVAQDIFCCLYEKGYIYPQTQTLLYSESERRFLPDRYVEGTCPECSYTNARGDQCDECGRLLDGTELIEPRSVLDGKRPIPLETTHLFLDLPAFADQLQAHLQKHAHHWRANTCNFTRNYIENLHGRAITRDLDWGIPVPLEGWQDKKLYIWFENIIGYLSASIEWAHNQGRPQAWKDWWYEPTAESYYFLGKDNIPFHTVFWPSELLGLERLYESDESKRLNLPTDVPANEYLTIEQRQFSKSRHWAVWLLEAAHRYSPDAIRYYVAATLPETSDSDFSWADFVRRNNTELLATWGNLVNRVLQFAYKHWGCVPPPGDLRDIDRELLGEIEAGFARVGSLIEAVKLRPALQEALALARQVNVYLDQSPWFGVIDVDKTAAATTVYTALKAIDSLKILLSPFLPHSAEQLHGFLGYEGALYGRLHIKTYTETEQTHQALVYEAGQGNGRWRPSTLPPGQKLAKPQPLFAKLDDSLIEEELARLYSN
jgi:methionyl-tRNA synthetase